MEINEAQSRALAVLEKYSSLQKQTGQNEWNREDLVRGFVGDVGDLVKLTMAADGVRDIPDTQAKLSHELADCLWSVFVIADKYGVNIEESFNNTMNELTQKIDKKLQQ